MKLAKKNEIISMSKLNPSTSQASHKARAFLVLITASENKKRGCSELVCSLTQLGGGLLSKLMLTSLRKTRGGS